MITMEMDQKHDRKHVFSVTFDAKQNAEKKNGRFVAENEN